MFATDLAMEVLPNIHLVGMLTVLFTALFRTRALIPIYIYVILTGLFYGFAIWWLAYLYIWLPLWGLAMLVPMRAPAWLCCAVYPLITCLHGLFFGVLYAPAQALFFGLNFEQTLAWISAGLVFDVIHAVSNLALGMLVYPLKGVLVRLLKRVGYDR